jgi:glutamine phosphoribosylpyrophosphate amidotransferase
VTLRSFFGAPTVAAVAAALDADVEEGSLRSSGPDRGVSSDMCGITGCVAFDDDLRARRDVVEAMTATMADRGPDESGIWIERHVALGHRRLAVIDVEGGVQPMTVDTPLGPVVLVYSGETYNFTELRQMLVV